MNAGARSLNRRPTTLARGRVAALDRRILIQASVTLRGTEMYGQPIPMSLFATSGAVVGFTMQREVLRHGVPVLPVVALVSPDNGPVNLDSLLTITGSGFSEPGVTLTVLDPGSAFSASLTNIVVVNDGKITAKIPASTLTALGVTTLTLSTTHGPSTATYTGTTAVPAPTLDLIDPESAGVGNTITFTGTGFVVGTVFQIDDHGVWTNFDNIILDSETSARGDIPSLATSPSYPVRVHNAIGDGNYGGSLEIA